MALQGGFLWQNGIIPKESIRDIVFEYKTKDEAIREMNAPTSSEYELRDLLVVFPEYLEMAEREYGVNVRELFAKCGEIPEGVRQAARDRKD